MTTDAKRPPEPQMDVYSAVRWSAVAKYGAQTVEVVTSIIVARIVAPECYGLLGMAIVITGFLMVFQSLGFGSVLIQQKEITESLTSSLFFVNLAVCVLLALGLVAGAPLCSWAYGDVRVGPIVATLSLTFLFTSLTLIPSSLLNRRLAFRRLAYVDIATSAARAVSVILLALAGWGVWALVWSSILGSAVSALLLYLVCEWRPRWLFSWSEVRSVFGFGANLTGFSIFNYFARNADNFIIGAFLGATPLGYYSLAYRILLFPRDAISGVVMRVLFPAFSRMQDDDARLKAAYLRACGAIAFLTFPMMLGMMVVAQPFVEVVLNSTWLPAVPLIYVLAPIGMFHSIATTTGNLYLAKGRADWLLRWGIVSGLLTCASFVAGLPWGVLGVAIAYAVVNVILIVPVFTIPFRLVKGLTLRGLVESLAPYAMCAGFMAVLVLGLRCVLEAFGVSNVLVLFASIMAGMISYAGMILCAHPPVMGEILRCLPDRYASFLRRHQTCRDG